MRHHLLTLMSFQFLYDLVSFTKHKKDVLRKVLTLFFSHYYGSKACNAQKQGEKTRGLFHLFEDILLEFVCCEAKG